MPSASSSVTLTDALAELGFAVGPIVHPLVPYTSPWTPPSPLERTPWLPPEPGTGATWPEPRADQRRSIAPPGSLLPAPPAAATPFDRPPPDAAPVVAIEPVLPEPTPRPAPPGAPRPLRVAAAPWSRSGPPWREAQRATVPGRVITPVPPVSARRRRRAAVAAVAFVVGFAAGWGAGWLAGDRHVAEIAPIGQTTLSRNGTSSLGSFTATPFS